MGENGKKDLLNSELLQKLDEFIRKYYKNQLLRGIIFFIGGLLSFFLIISVLEYFGRFNTTVRTFLFYSLILFGLIILVRFIAIPLARLYKIGRILDYDAASRIIGKHFGNIQDKLLNTLQLNRRSQNELDNRFLAASIEQKISELRPVKFSAAIDFKSNKKYLKYAYGPFAVLMIIMIIAPGFKETTTRLIQHDKHFAIKAPFDFLLKNKTLEFLQNDDVEIDLGMKGNVLPEEVYLVTEGNRFKMKKEDKSSFLYMLKNVQKNFFFHFESNGFSSEEYELKVKQRPVLLDFKVHLDYPEYTGRKDESINNIGDMTIPAGTVVKWDFNTKNVEQLSLAVPDHVYTAQNEGKDKFSFKKLFKNTELLKIKTSNKNTQNKDSILYQINVIPDAFPQISMKEKRDSNVTKLIYFVGDINDDYGFSRLLFHYKFIESKEEDKLKKGLLSFPVSIIKNQTAQNFYYMWDMNSLDIKPGEKLEYYFEIWDNDAINGSKATRTGNGLFAAPTLEQIEKQTDESNKAIKSDMAEAIKESKKLEEEISKYEQKLSEKKSLSWEDKKQLQDLIKQHEDLQKKMEDIVEQNKTKDKNEEEYKKIDPETKQKQEELQKLMEELMDKDMKDLLEKLKELLKDNNRDELQKEMNNFKLGDKDLKKKMERALELLKQLELEKKMEETIDKLKELAEEQKKLSEDSKKDGQNSEELKKQQEELNKKFEDIKKDLKEIQEKNKQLEKQNDLSDHKEKEKSIDKEQKESSDQLEKENNKKASPHQKKAGDEMEEMSEQMQGEMDEMMAERAEEDYNTLRQILENLVQVSKDQENLMKDFKAVGGYNPKFVELAQAQKKLRDDTKIIEDSLFALSKRVIKIQSFINKEMGLVNNNMDKALEKLGFRDIRAVVNHQQYIMTSLNNLAVMLSEVLKNMQDNMKNSKPNPSCKNPKKGKSGKPSMKSLREMQEKMNKEMEQMGKNGKEGKRPTSEQLAKMAAQQAALRKKIQDLQKELEKEGNGKKLGDLNKTQEMMDEVEKDIVNKNVNEETLKRQREILTRLLEHERAEKEQDEDDKRQSNEGKQVKRTMPPSLQEYLKQQQKGQELLRSVSPALSPYYKDKVKLYFKSLE
ncbi:MAG: hypothetical protein H6605_07180 [Flavobacteriales bacterium]|nr:hypothetical protein [Flavobacteriales bacterium]